MIFLPWEIWVCIKDQEHKATHTPVHTGAHLPHLQVAFMLRRRWRLTQKLQQRMEKADFESWGHKRSQRHLAKGNGEGCKETRSQWAEGHDRTLLPLEHPWNNKLFLCLLIVVAFADVCVSLSLIHFLIREQKENAEPFLPECLLMSLLPFFLQNSPRLLTSPTVCLSHRTCVCLCRFMRVPTKFSANFRNTAKLKC